MTFKSQIFCLQMMTVNTPTTRTKKKLQIFLLQMMTVNTHNNNSDKRRLRDPNTPFDEASIYIYILNCSTDKGLHYMKGALEQ